MIYKIEQYFKQYLSDPDNKVGTRNKEVRDIWLRKRLKEIKPSLRILDAGAGQFRYKSFCDHLKYVSQDFNCYEGGGDGKALQNEKWNQKNIDIISDITKIPEPDKSFDAIMCVEVLEHLPDPLKALLEFKRLLKKDGTLLLTVPFSCLTHMSPYFYITGFSRYYFEKWLKELGFKNIEITYNGNYFEWIAQELRRLERVSSRYTNLKTFTRKQRWALNCILKLLDNLSHLDKSSSELLSLGLFIKAEKRK